MHKLHLKNKITIKDISNDVINQYKNSFGILLNDLNVEFVYNCSNGLTIDFHNFLLNRGTLVYVTYEKTSEYNKKVKVNSIWTHKVKIHYLFDDNTIQSSIVWSKVEDNDTLMEDIILDKSNFLLCNIGKGDQLDKLCQPIIKYCFDNTNVFKRFIGIRKWRNIEKSYNEQLKDR